MSLLCDDCQTDLTRYDEIDLASMTVLRPWWNLTVFTSQLLLNKEVTEFRAAPITCIILLEELLTFHSAQPLNGISIEIYKNRAPGC